MKNFKRETSFFLIIIVQLIALLSFANTFTVSADSETTVTLQQGVDGYLGASDTYIYQWAPTTNYSSVSLLKVGYKQQNAGLLRFDLSSIPVNAVISQATLHVYASGWGGANMTIDAFRVIRNVTINQATWNQAQTGKPWATPGCNNTATDRSATPEASFTTSGIRTWYSFNLKSLVQKWVNGTYANNGIILRGATSLSTSIFYFASAEDGTISLRPKLVITYTIPRKIWCVANATDLQNALTNAGTNGLEDIIQVQQGTYLGSFTFSSNEGKNITLLGGYSLGCDSRVVDPSNTILQGNRSLKVLSLNNSNGGDISIEGFTVQDGFHYFEDGAGVFAHTGSETGSSGNINLNHNIIQYNQSLNSSGGGVFAGSNSGTGSSGNITLTHNIITDNNARASGGGVHASSSGLTQAGNIILTNNTVTRNSANGGGGVYADSYSESQSGDIILTRNIIIDNGATYDGGGVYVRTSSTNQSGHIILTNNTIASNGSAYSGGGVDARSYSETQSGNITLSNNTIAGNGVGSEGQGGGLRLGMANNTIWIYNNIIWGNTAGGGRDIYLDGTGTAKGYHNDYSDMSGTWTEFGNNIDADPLFVDPVNADYHLRQNSPCIDKGTNSAPELPGTDFEGNERILDGDFDGTKIVDMGADEYALAPWPMFRHDTYHTGRSPYVGPTKPGIRWRYQTGRVIESSAAIGPDGSIYIGSTKFLSSDEYLFAFNSDGSLKWKYKTGGIMHSSPAIATDSTIYVGCQDGYLYAINPDGSEKWKFNTTLTPPYAEVYSSPVIGPDGTVYAGAERGYLYAIYPNGTLKWRTFLASRRVLSSPAVGADGNIYIGSDAGCLHAVNPSGTLIWSKCSIGGPCVPSRIESSPAIGPDGTIYVGVEQYGPPEICSRGALWAIDPSIPEIKWSYPTDGAINSSPAIANDNTIYVGSEDSYLYAINPDGTLKWRYQIGGLINSSPAIDADGTIYVGSEGTYLYAINSDGTFRWRYQTGSPFFPIHPSPAIGANGTIYIGSNDGCIYAIQSLVTLQQGAEGYSGCEDTYIYQYSSNTNYSSQNQFRVGYKQQNAALLRFNLSSIPSNAIITKATLEVYAQGWGGANMTIDAYRINRDVTTFSQTNWNQSNIGNLWGAPGCNHIPDDRNATSESSLTTSGIRIWYSFNLTYLVQQWVNDSAPNNGVIIRGASPTSTSVFYFTSAENGDANLRPKLTISFHQ